MLAYKQYRFKEEDDHAQIHQFYIQSTGERAFNAIISWIMLLLVWLLSLHVQGCRFLAGTASFIQHIHNCCYCFTLFLFSSINVTQLWYRGVRVSQFTMFHSLCLSSEVGEFNIWWNLKSFHDVTCWCNLSACSITLNATSRTWGERELLDLLLQSFTVWTNGRISHPVTKHEKPSGTIMTAPLPLLRK